jgi:hypothetical protein
MAYEGKLLKPPDLPITYSIPADPVGRRPAGEGPCGSVALVWFSLVASYYHFRQLVVAFLLAAGLLVCAAVLVLVPSWHLFGKVLSRSEWGLFNLGVSLVLITPLIVGYTYVALLAIQELRPRAREVLHPVRSGRRLGNVLVAGGLPAAGGWAVTSLMGLIGRTLPPIPEDLFWTEFFRGLPGTLALLLVLPLVFSGIDVLAARHDFRAAIVRSIGFMVRQPRLFVGFAVISVLVNLIIQAGIAAIKISHVWLEAHLGGDAILLLILLLLVWFWVLLIFETVVFVHFYREFVWREREAVPPASAVPTCS